MGAMGEGSRQVQVGCTYPALHRCSGREVHDTAYTHTSKSRGKVLGSFPHGGDEGKFKESSSIVMDERSGKMHEASSSPRSSHL